MPSYRVTVELEWIDHYDASNEHDAARMARAAAVDALSEGYSGAFTVENPDGTATTLMSGDL